MSDDVGVNAEDARVPVPHPGQGVGPKLLDVAGQGNGVPWHQEYLKNWKSTSNTADFAV